MTRPLIIAAAFTLGLAITTVLAHHDQPDTVTVQAASAGDPPNLWSHQQLPPSFNEFMEAQTTTTHTHPPRARTEQRRAETPGGNVNGYPCGADLPPCRVLRCESGGNPTARNPRSSASGLWQVLDSTWAGFGGYQRAWLAPVDVQNDKARLLWAGGRGAFHWRACL